MDGRNHVSRIIGVQKKNILQEFRCLKSKFYYYKCFYLIQLFY